MFEPNGVVALTGAASLPVGGALLALSALPSLRRPGGTPAWILLVVGMSFYALLAHRALRTYGLTQRPRDLVVAIGCTSVVLDLMRSGASRPLAGDLSAAEIVTAEEEYLGARVRALMVELERKDRSTERHTRRVALLREQAGKQYDAKCVHALERVVLGAAAAAPRAAAAG